MADISSTLSFQDHMSSAMQVISNRMDEAAASAKIAKYELEDLQNTERAAKAHLDALTSATIKDNQAIKEAQKAWQDATKAVDAQTLKVSKYETALLQNEIRLNKMKQQEQQVKTAIDQTTQSTQKGTIGFESMQGKIVTLSAAFQLFNQAKNIISSINSKINEFVAQAEVEMRVQDQLSIITKQRMGLMDEEIRSLINLASAQQQVGVVGDEVTVAGMAGIAAFVRQKSSIEALTPAMDNLAVKMYGYNATAESMDMISKSLGKAMLGDVGALSRMGIKIDDVTKKRLMHLREEERAIELAKIIKNVTGDMNEEMAKTPFGQMTQANNRLSDSYEKLGAALLPLQVRMAELWSTIIEFLVDKLPTIVPLAVVTVGALTTAFIALKVQAFLASVEMQKAAIETIVAWWKVAAPFIAIIGIIGTVSVALNAMGLNFKQQAQNVLISINWIITAVQNLIAHIENIGIAIHNAFSKDKWDYKQIKANDLYTNTQKAQSQMDKLSGKFSSTRSLLGTVNKNNGFNGLGGIEGLTTNTSGGKALKTQNQGDISLKEDDIELLHDIATRDYAQYFQQLTPNLTIPNMVIHETADVNQVIGAVANAITGSISSSMTGGYATV